MSSKRFSSARVVGARCTHAGTALPGHSTAIRQSAWIANA